MDAKFLNIDDNADMGLNNTICTEKKYYCRSKRVFLSEEDVKNKKCKCKPTFDMLGVHLCNWLEEVKEERTEPLCQSITAS